MSEATRLRALVAELDDDVTALRAIRERAEDLLRRDLDGVDDWVAPSAAGYVLHQFYTGTESALHRIARCFENDVQGSEWHAALLRRMRLEIPDVRPAVIEAELARRLDEYRRFRHLFRHAYELELDWRRLQPLLTELPNRCTDVIAALERFSAFALESARRLERGPLAD